MSERIATRRSQSVLDGLLSRRILFVTGKGGTGKSTVAAALLLAGARRGKRTLGIEADARGQLASALGAKPGGFDPVLVQSNVSLVTMRPEDSLREYLRVYFKIPRIVSLTPLSRAFDFIATSVPGPKDMLTVGKVVYEEGRTTETKTPMWDLIVIDAPPTGRALAQIMAAREMLKLTRGGIIRGQLEWIDTVLTDSARSALVLTSLAEEMAAIEAIELYDAAARAHHITVAACVVNRVPLHVLHRRDHELLTQMCDATHAGRIGDRLGGPIATVAAGIAVADRLHTAAAPHLRQLRTKIDAPVVEVPVLAAKDGLATSRAVADVLTSAVL